MHQPIPTYDCAIIGGGLAGLCLSIQLARKGQTVILFEKEQYPFHKVCGEYISMESWLFLESLGISLSTMELPRVTQLVLSAPDGRLIESSLPLGGFGISRYTLDAQLATQAIAAGVQLMTHTRIQEVKFAEDAFLLFTAMNAYRARVCCGTYGKRSNLDIKWKRRFTQNAHGKGCNYIGVKYHASLRDFPKNSIALHNFENGYCGICAIDQGRYNICYLTTAANLQKSNNSIPEMEEKILYQNPHLKTVFTQAKWLHEQPLTISQVSFLPKTQVENHVLLTGDAAGMIAPLCGNGMSMAMHGSKIVAGYIHQFLQGRISRQELEAHYTREWKKQFARRLATGRMIQHFFGKKWLTNGAIRLLQSFPSVLQQLISATHGQSF